VPHADPILLELDLTPTTSGKQLDGAIEAVLRPWRQLTAQADRELAVANVR
jgi:hypothetical protein